MSAVSRARWAATSPWTPVFLSVFWLWLASCLFGGLPSKSRLLRELNPEPLAPEARIMPLDQAANDQLQQIVYISFNCSWGTVLFSIFWFWPASSFFRTDDVGRGGPPPIHGPQCFWISVGVVGVFWTLKRRSCKIVVLKSKVRSPGP